MPTELVTLTGQSFIFPEQEFGVLGDGSNETSKVQAAIDSASLTGRILILPPFEITVTTLIIPNTGVTILGVSGNAGQPASILKSTGINAPIISCGNNIQNFLLDNVKLKGTNGGTSQHGIYFSGTTANLFVLNRLYVVSCGGNGIKINSTNFNYHISNCFVSDCNLDLIYIDAANAIASSLNNCFAGIVRANKSGYNVVQGQITLRDCNGILGSNAGTRCLTVGTGATQAQVVLDHCNLESFTAFGAYVDDASDLIVRNNTSFTAPVSGTVQPLYMVGPFGKSSVDVTTKFSTGGAGYDNPSNLPVKIFSRWIDAPGNLDPLSAAKITNFWNSGSAREEPFMNLASRYSIKEVTVDPYTETTPSANYLACLVGLAHTINLFDPQAQDCPEGRQIIVKDEVGNAASEHITVQTVNARFIDGSSTKVISTNYGVLKLVQHGGVYWQIP